MSNLVLHNLAFMILPMVVAITLHEAAHGLVARFLGDPTATRLGRVSLNPLRHVDPIGTILLPILLYYSSGGAFIFGYAKPVPIDARYFRNPRRDMAITAAAGPLSNLVIAYISILLLHFTSIVSGPILSGSVGDFIAKNLVFSFTFNIIIAVFNLLPIPPLDGGRVAVGLLPRFLARPLSRIEPIGILILLALLVVLPTLGRAAGVNFDIFGWILKPAYDYLSKALLLLAGLSSAFG